MPEKARSWRLWAIKDDGHLGLLYGTVTTCEAASWKRFFEHYARLLKVGVEEDPRHKGYRAVRVRVVEE